jgi:16S rRNA C967 or C1407 C5-methylase (RsmB/RsmF family)
MKKEEPLLLDFLGENGRDASYYDQKIMRSFFVIDEKITDLDIKKDIPSAQMSCFSSRCYFLDQQEFKFRNSFLYNEHKIIPIDGASVIAVLCLELKCDDLVLDLCCSPGAKLTLISSLLKGGKGSVTGVDKSKKRLEISRSLSKKFKLPNVRLFNHDGTKFNIAPHVSLSPPAKPFIYDIDKKPFHSSGIFRKRPGNLIDVCQYDKIIVDVPCTNDGSIKLMKENYSCGWKSNSFGNHSKESLVNLITLQYKLLERGFILLKPGGILIYSTCSLSQEQNSFILRKLMANYGDEVIPLNFPENVHEKLNNKYSFLISPEEFGFGALYIARISKRKK